MQRYSPSAVTLPSERQVLRCAYSRLALSKVSFFGVEQGHGAFTASSTVLTVCRRCS